MEEPSQRRCVIDPLEIACMTQHLYDKRNIRINRDLAEYIYDTYIVSLYSKCSVVELMDYLNWNRIVVNCKLNKASIIQFMVEKQILPEIPTDIDTECVKWYVDDRNGLWFHKFFHYFKIKINDLFIINQNCYKLLCIKPLRKEKFKTDMDYVVLLKNLRNEKKTKLSLEAFIELLHRDDVIYEHSGFFIEAQAVMQYRVK